MSFILKTALLLETWKQVGKRKRGRPMKTWTRKTEKRTRENKFTSEPVWLGAEERDLWCSFSKAVFATRH